MKSTIVLLIDRTGSMHNKIDEAVNGINKFIEDQKELPDEALITMFRFDSNAHERFRPTVDIKDCVPLQRNEVEPRAMTPLWDAVGDTIESVEKELPERVIMVISTDGLENASHKHSASSVKQKIEELKGKNWDFIFIGAGINAFVEAGKLGIDPSTTAQVTNTGHGQTVAYAAVSASVKNLRSGNKVDNLGTTLKE